MNIIENLKSIEGPILVIGASGFVGANLFNLIKDHRQFNDDLVALTAVISLWSKYITPEIRNRARLKLDRWFPI